MSVPGVPQLLNAAATLANTATLLVADAISVARMFEKSGWGVNYAASQTKGSIIPVFTPKSSVQQLLNAASNGLTQLYSSALLPSPIRPVAAASTMPDTIVSLDYKRDYRITDAQMEKGAFESYNKVQKPYSVSLRMAKGGTESDKQNFLAWVEDRAASLDLYDVITPEKIYTDCNIEGFSLHRSAQDGAGLIVVDINFTEIRETVVSTLEFMTTVNPGVSQNAPSGIN